jgi:hypothetical protein
MPTAPRCQRLLQPLVCELLRHSRLLILLTRLLTCRTCLLVCRGCILEVLNRILHFCQHLLQLLARALLRP